MKTKMILSVMALALALGGCRKSCFSCSYSEIHARSRDTIAYIYGSDTIWQTLDYDVWSKLEMREVCPSSPLYKGLEAQAGDTPPAFTDENGNTFHCQFE